MHPVVAPAVVVAVIGFLAGGAWPRIAVVGGCCLLLLPTVPALSLRRLFGTVWRLRFFYLSLAVLYAGFTPGTPLFPALTGLSPSVEGINEGLRHIAILVVIVAAVQLFMASVSREELVGALRWWLRPMRPLGADPDRTALRLMLVADVLPRLRGIAEQPAPPLEGLPAWRRLPDRAASLFERTLDEAEHAPLPTLDLPRLRQPGLRHWWPLVTVVAVLSAL